MRVLKFGGTSVANAENMARVVSIILSEIKKGERLIVVLSALGGVTDALIEIAELASKGDVIFREKLQIVEQRHLQAVKQLIPLDRQSGVLSMVKRKCNELEDIFNGIFLLKELSPRIRDIVTSYGEILSSSIFQAKLASLNIDSAWKDARELIKTDSHFGAAGVDFNKTNKNIQEYTSGISKDVTVVPGFIASDQVDNTTTLGRGGSDYTAAIFGAGAKADAVEIWTDVSGMMTADPRLVVNARIIEKISYQEAMELSHFGAKVIYPPTIQPVMNLDIPVKIKNTFYPEHAGTVIHTSFVEKGNIIRGISSIGGLALLSLEGSGMVGIPGFSKRFFEALSAEKINVILITQSSSEHSICVGVDAQNSHRAREATDAAFAHEIETRRVEKLKVEDGLSIVALVGDNMKSHPGISGKMFGALGRNGINVRAIAQGSSERNISAVIATADVRKAVNVLHEEFFETTYKQANLFISGVGNVGSKLLAQLDSQIRHLQDHLRLQVRVTGLANSKKAVFSDNGIDLKNWKEQMTDGISFTTDQMLEEIVKKNLRNSIFVDVTADANLAMKYPKLLGKSVSVVACNKVACSGSMEYYRSLKNLAREFGSRFLFETNVGAGLPVIGTLNDLTRSGDSINRMEAVLSGTLNFVFNTYDGSVSFASVVRQAQDEGYTEPDPRLDLSGVDVMRKILILAREAGNELEMEDITNKSFLPESCMAGDVANFYIEMEKHEDHFRELIKEAKASNKKVKFVATFDKGKASVGLQNISPESDFYHLYGKDNAVLFYTDRYNEQPLVVKGAGAGADVTASGVFADIIRAAAPSSV